MFVNQKNLRESETYFDQIDSWGYGSMPFDSRYKWAQIMRIFHRNFGDNPTGLSIVDVGGGLGPLDLYFSRFGSVKNFDLSHDKTWFETDERGLLPGSVGPDSNMGNIERIAGDFLIKAHEVATNSVDFAYDSCSMIHFRRGFTSVGDTSPLSLTPLSLVLGFAQVFRILKGSGRLAFATDVALPRRAELKDMVHAQTYIKAAEACGFVADAEASDFNLVENKELATKYTKARSCSNFKYDASLLPLSLLKIRWPTTTRVSVVTTVFSGSLIPEPYVPVMETSISKKTQTSAQWFRNKSVALAFNLLDRR